MPVWLELGAVAMCLPAWFLAGRLAQQVKLPLITGYLIAGAVSGPSLLQLFKSNGLASLGFVDHACLGIIALAAGAELRLSELKKTKRQVSSQLPCNSSGAINKVVVHMCSAIAGCVHHPWHLTAVLAGCVHGNDDARALSSFPATPHTSTAASCSQSSRHASNCQVTCFSGKQLIPNQRVFHGVSQVARPHTACRLGDV